MEIQELVRKVRSGVIKIEFIDNDQTVLACGSGFLSQGFLVTNNHVLQGPKHCDVRLTWQPNKEREGEPIVIKSFNFKDAFKVGSEESAHDYAVLDLPELKAPGLNLFEFDLSGHDESEIGDEVVLLGYPFGHNRLVAHAGYISSFYTKDVVDVIQIDASVNASNSGGPLLCVRTGRVIGIVSRKETGITEMFKDLATVFDKNIQALRPVLGGIQLGPNNIDPIYALMQSQVQMKIVCAQIERSANVGIGYAFGVRSLLADIDSLSVDN